MTVFEDKRLPWPGINPDSNPIEILLAADRNIKRLEAERAAEKSANADKP